MKLHELFPLPPEVQVIAWQAAYSLITDHLGRLSPKQRAIAANIAKVKANTLDWEQCQDARRIWARVVA